MVPPLSTPAFFVHTNECLSAGASSTVRRGPGAPLVTSSRRVDGVHCRSGEKLRPEMKILNLQKQSPPSHLRKRGRRSSGPGLTPKERDFALTNGHWRLFGVEVAFAVDLGKDDYSVSQPVLEAVSAILNCSAMQLPASAFSVVRKSLDARSDPIFVYTIDLDVKEFTSMEPAAKAVLRKLGVVPGKVEFSPTRRKSLDLVDLFRDLRAVTNKYVNSAGQVGVQNLVDPFQDLRALSNTNKDVNSAGQFDHQDLIDRFQDLGAVTNKDVKRAGQFKAQNINAYTSGVLQSEELLEGSVRSSDELPAFSNGDSSGVSGSKELPQGSMRSSNDLPAFSKGDSSGVLRSKELLQDSIRSSDELSPFSNGESSGVSRSKELPRSSMRSSSEMPAFPSAALGSPSKGAARVVVVGGGPAGLFATLALAEAGVKVTLLERGQPVESRGKDIGKLAVRRILNPNSNFCFGEGGAGTWSDGKLTTRIGKNGSSVQTVLGTLVRFGAPPSILVDGKPHVGTDKLVRILRSLRAYLLGLDVTIKFGTLMNDLEVSGGRVRGVWASEGNDDQSKGELLRADAVVLAVGHSARDVYEKLLHHDVSMAVKPFAVGFRIEHPQELVNEMQYRRWATEVQRGRGKLPVADYRLAAADSSSSSGSAMDGTESSDGGENHAGGRSCFSFCMCPGGQVVLTSTNARELCVNGMSYSNRSSRWANAALVVPVSEPDLIASGLGSGPLAGVAFQREIEREAAVRGGGNFCCPVQRVTDFLDDSVSRGMLPSSSYRLGVKEAFLGDLLPMELTDSLKKALILFDRQLPGFISEKALLHGAETRTSAPVRIRRSKESFESTSMPGLYPIGEGAGYAGGIVSAAVDGMLAGLALAKQLCPENAALQLFSV